MKKNIGFLAAAMAFATMGESMNNAKDSVESLGESFNGIPKSRSRRKIRNYVKSSSLISALRKKNRAKNKAARIARRINRV